MKVATRIAAKVSVRARSWLMSRLWNISRKLTQITKPPIAPMEVETVKSFWDAA